jgi:hypothetical protein
MDVQQTGRTCPKCGSADYAFRGRKRIEPTEGQEARGGERMRCQRPFSAE